MNTEKVATEKLIASDTPQAERVTLSIIIVVYKGREYVDACLDSIRAKITCTYEVILLDNGSPDGVGDYVEAKFPWVRVVRSTENLGFTGGNNLAARHATGKYYLLFNADTILLSDVAPAIARMEQDPEIGVIGARMYGRDKELRPSTGRFPRAWRLWRFKGLFNEPRQSYGKDRKMHGYRVDWVEGSFLLTTADNWRALNGLDEGNFLYGDDVDFCRGTVGRGLAVVHCDDIEYIHFGGYNPSSTGYLYFGFRRYHFKFSGSAERILAEIVLKVGLHARILLFGSLAAMTRNPLFVAKYRGFIETWRKWPRELDRPWYSEVHQKR